MNKFNNKCPSCYSKNINDVDTGHLPIVYAMKPIECQDCYVKFEFSEQVRLSVPLVLLGLFLLTFFVSDLKSRFGSDTTFIIFCAFILISFGNMLYSLWKNQFVLWSKNSIRRSIVNYGSLLFIAISGIVFYATKT